MSLGPLARDFYDGATLHVRCYDSMHTDGVALLEGDVAFYEALARRAGGPVLEIGIGTGRVGVQLAQAGLQVTGLDLSQEMLALAARRAASVGCGDRLTLVRGDMRDFSLPEAGSYGAVLVPFRAFQVLLTPQDQRAALATFRRHLRAGGLLALHLFDPNLDFLQPDVLMRDMHGIDAATGRRAEAVMEAATFDYINQVRRDRWRYRAFDAAGVLVEEQQLDLTLRWTWRWEMRHLLELEGFIVENCYADFANSPPSYAKEQVFVARTAA